MAQGDNVFYYIKQAELVPDKYGKHIKIKMISAYTGNGKFVKHMKLDKELLQELKDSVILPAKPKQIKDVE
tara:strand:+ start:423 stop:635 length:213 start_codon:yes stop_codon:yes gene_type:complete